MTELKTLKDFEINCREEGEAYSIELRQEAIKWWNYNCNKGKKGVCDFIWEFFNITQEDLKHD